MSPESYASRLTAIFRANVPGKGKASMGLFVGRAIIYLIFGFFVYETTKQFNKVFGLSLSPYFGMGYVILSYAVQEFANKRFKAGDQAVPFARPMYRRVEKLMPFIAGILTAILFLYVFAVFAGLIYNEILKNQ